MSTENPFDNLTNPEGGCLFPPVRKTKGRAGAKGARSHADAALEALSIHLAILDQSGTIVRVNGAWRSFAQANGYSTSHLIEGSNYFKVCDTAHGPDSEGAADFGNGLRAVLQGRQAVFQFEYPCHSPQEQRWFLGKVTRFLGEDRQHYLVVTHSEITARKRLEEQILRLNENLGEQVRARTQELEQERNFSNALIEDSPAYIAAVSSKGRTLMMNDALLNALGRTREEVIGTRFLFGSLPREGQAAIVAAIQAQPDNESHALARLPIRTAAGAILQVEWRARVVRHPDGQVKHFFAVGIDVTVRERQDRLEQVRMRILEGLARRGSLESLQGMLMDHIQEIWPDHPVTFRFLEARMGTLHVALNRGLPDFYLAALNGLAIGPEVGCKAAAAHAKTRIVAEDIQTHPDWVPFRELAAQAGLGACWSEPVFSSDGEVIGTFAVYARHPERPQEADLNLLQEVASLATLLYGRHHGEAELALRDAAMKAAANSIVIIDRAGLVRWSNPAFAVLTGYDPQELKDRHISILKSGRHDRAFYDDLWSRILSGQVWKGEICNRRKDGTEYLEAQVITPVCGPDGAVTHFISIRQDVTAKKATETRIKILSQAVEQAPGTVVITDAKGQIEYVNLNFELQTGYTAEEVLGKTQALLKSGLTRPGTYQDLWRTILSDQVWRGELVNRRKNGELFWERIAIAPITDEQGVITHFVANTEDITGQRLLEENHQRLSAALEQAEDAAVITDLAGTITFANPAFLRVLGLQERQVLAEPIDRFLADPDQPGKLEEMLTVARDGQPWKGRHQVLGAGEGRLTLDGTVSPVRNLEGEVASIAAVFRDITLELQRGRHLIQAQKMDSLGALAGGVAHDFNNILSSILITTEMIEWQLEPDSPIRPRLEIIYQVSRQARDLSRRILSFSRRSEHKQIPFDLSNMVREAGQLLQATLPRNVILQKGIASSLWVTGDPAQVNQVVMNLAINGSQAIGAQEGHLTLTLAERTLTEADGLPLAAGSYAELSVRDTGTGMTPEILGKIFEPFFTTKDAENGTGLGLSVVHGIVHSHAGHIQVETALGQGSCFRAFFPLTAGAVHAPGAHLDLAVRGSERILLVDDEDIVIALTKQGLQALGYEVVAKTSPIDAFEVFQARPGAFDLLITDLTLPGFSGAELVRRIRRLRPGVPAILTTGTASVVESMPSLAGTFAEVLAKPLAPTELGAAIRRVMAPSRPPVPSRQEEGFLAWKGSSSPPVVEGEEHQEQDPQPDRRGQAEQAGQEAPGAAGLQAGRRVKTPPDRGAEDHDDQAYNP